ADALVHAADLRGHRAGDGEAGGVVLGAVDALAGGETLHRGAQRLVGLGRGVGGLQRADIGVDDRHVKLLRSVRALPVTIPWQAAAETKTGSGAANLSLSGNGKRRRSGMENGKGFPA